MRFIPLAYMGKTQVCKILLSRMTAFIENESDLSSSFSKYMDRKFEVEHIWANKFREHQDEFDQEHEFETCRNQIGGLVLLQRGTNQSYGAKPLQKSWSTM